MHRNLFTLSTLLVFSLFSTLLLSACGGGGSGSSIPASYTGSTEPAVITSSNAQIIIDEAYEGGSQAQGAMVIPLSADSSSSPQFKAVTDTLNSVTNQLLVGPTVTTMALAEQVIPGECVSGGGEASISITSASGTSFSGTIDFISYSNDCSITLDGSIRFTMVSDSYVTYTFNSLVTSDNVSGESFVLDGTVSAEVNTNTQGGSITYNMVFIDRVSQETYYFNYTLTATPGVSAGCEELTVTGRFYDHDHGYVDITTVETLIECDLDPEPSSGILHFDGADGTWATYEFKPGGDYVITYFDGTVERTITPTP